MLLYLGNRLIFDLPDTEIEKIFLACLSCILTHSSYHPVIGELLKSASLMEQTAEKSHQVHKKIRMPAQHQSLTAIACLCTSAIYRIEE